ncbi:retron system putative HNH endonuclease [Candidatus Synechococcus spongiarum]|uniref:TIGR02646 family protein n=1 Tax=Candidatus Synechococcus spongiarum TaxID=431041 RepID=A0A170T6Q2_9SYNE|nr:retron system putative HNH endonuclease [Candidatus Synechococcus spongiarum]CZB15175.1 hypothetical protein FLM9_584 [Candidatus Synechococcus spongiarum]
MKPIRKLDEASNGLKGLKDYLVGDGEQANWEGFRSHQGGKAYRKLVRALCYVQHGLCGYCEINIIPEDKQVEHVKPRSCDKAGELKPDNMMLCCQGGTTPSTNDNARKRKPIKGNRSFGEAKGNSIDPQFIDPRDLPPLPSLVRVDDEGKISADKDACTDAEIDVNRVEKTIQILGLNVARLRSARKQQWATLHTTSEDHFNNRQVMEEAARMQLLPGEDGRLPPFFSTSRSYFGPVAERILAEEPREWI